MSDQSDLKSPNSASSNQQDARLSGQGTHDVGHDQSNQSGYDPLEDDLFAHGDTVTFSSVQESSGRSKWLIILGGVLVALAVLLGLKMLTQGDPEPVATPTEQTAATPAQSAADSDELALLSEEIELPMPSSEQEAEEQVDAMTSEQELLNEQIAMYEEQLATSQKLSELKAAQIASLEQQINSPQ